MATYTRANLQARVYADLKQQDSADNDLLPAATVQEALMIAEQELARRLRCFRRSHTMSAVDEQALYALPEDFVRLIDITYDDDESPLDRGDEKWQQRNNTDYRSEEAGTPDKWWMHDGRQFRLSPPPDVSAATTMSLDGYFVPLQIGGGITSIDQSETPGTVTVTTNYRHNLRAGDGVTISGSDVSAANAAWTVATAPTATTFTFSDATVTDTSTDCNLYYTGGYLPMLADSDVSYHDFRMHLALAHYAVYWLGTNHLIDDAVAVAAAERAVGKYEDMIARHEDDRWI